MEHFWVSVLRASQCKVSCKDGENRTYQSRVHEANSALVGQKTVLVDPRQNGGEDGRRSRGATLDNGETIEDVQDTVTYFNL